MPFTQIRIEAEGQLAATEAVLYTCPVGRVALCRLWIANTEAGTAYPVHVLTRKSGESTSRRRTGAAYQLSAGGHDVFPDSDGTYNLGPGDTLRAYAGTANKVDFSLEVSESTI